MISERTLGNSGLTTPPLILGGNVFGWTADRDTSFSILDAFVESGGRMIDTADVYSAWVPGNKGGDSETIIGAWLAKRGQRQDVIIATKVGMEVDGGKGLSPKRIATAVEASLKRLGTDYIDLYFAHRDDTETPLAETLEAFDRLVRAGKVRAIGASNYQTQRLAEALKIGEENGFTLYSVLQPQFNLLERHLFEGDLQDLCLERNIAVVPYYGLASGFLTGKYRSREDLTGKTRAGAVEKYLNDYGFGVLAALDQVAAQCDASPAQVALAWVAAQPAVGAPIASATSVRQVQELVAAMRPTLTADQLLAIDVASRRRSPGNEK